MKKLQSGHLCDQVLFLVSIFFFFSRNKKKRLLETEVEFVQLQPLSS